MRSLFTFIISLIATLFLGTTTLADRLFFDNDSHLDRVITFFPATTTSGQTFKNPGPLFWGAGRNGTVDLSNLGPDGNPSLGWSGCVKVLFPSQDPASPVPEGKFTFHGQGDLTYFELSLVADPNKNDGIHWIHPVNDQNPGLALGCDHFPCDGIYSKPGSVQTKSTLDTDFQIIIKE
ncbi:hypothetical protein HYALB_00012757 [Hymenoscyphus albidus]|uniref:Uncharacterized protein n=1 Tax=Hymenoscyphus albidus TaxID=595503 RepID=A0A9N9QAH0_9HELO|nr:hypothetical protein HYALB_00012757 [Hymenoscyphus albidus]